MNALICIGENTAYFKPLRDFSIRYAENILGEIQQNLFIPWEKISPQLLENVLEDSCSLLILAKEDLWQSTLDILLKLFPEITAQKSFDGYSLRMQKYRILLRDYPKVFIEPTKSFLEIYGLLEEQAVFEALQNLAESFGVELREVAKLDDVRIMHAKASKEILEKFAEAIKSQFQNKVFPTFNFAANIIQLLKDTKQKITTAESCTGGLVAYFLTKESGASEVFDGGVVSYANAIKEDWLKVSSQNLEKFGAVSKEVVYEMLKGALKMSNADFAIATSGVAGPTGGSPNKPVGTIFIGAMSKDGEHLIKKLNFSGDRNFIQEQSCLYGYCLFLKLFFKTIDF